MKTRDEMDQTADTPRLSHDGERFPHPERLKRSAMEGLEATLYDEWCAATAEGDADGSLPAPVVLEAETLRGMRLRPDLRLHFPAKRSLKHRSPVQRTAWRSAAAAMVAAGLVTYLLRESPPAPPQPVTACAIAPAAELPPQEARPAATPSPAPAAPAKPAARPAPPYPEPDPLPEAAGQTAPLAAGHALLARAPELGQPEIVVKLDIPTQSQKNTLIPALRSEMEVLADAGMRNLARLQLAVDRIHMQGIAAAGLILRQQTVITEVYDGQGNLISYGVQAGRINLRKEYQN